MKIVVADGSAVVREAVQAVGAEVGDLEIVRTVERGALVLPCVARTSPDVVILDTALSGLDGFECLMLLTDRFPGVRVIMIGDLVGIGTLTRAFALGASAVLERGVDAPALARLLADALFVGDEHAAAGSSRPSVRRPARGARSTTARPREIHESVAAVPSSGHARPPAPV